MADFDENLVREYFELNGFFVRRFASNEDVSAAKKLKLESVGLDVFHPHREESAAPSGFQLFSADVERLKRARVVILGWENLRFTPSMLKNGRKLIELLRQDVSRALEPVFGESTQAEQSSGLRILVFPMLPATDPHRGEGIEILRSAGVDGILGFNTILENLIRRVEVTRNYKGSELLQLMRVLKLYDLIREPQMQLFS